MTDYLERIFLAEEKNVGGGGEAERPAAAGVETETEEFRRPELPAAEPVEEMSTNPSRDVEIPARPGVRLGEEPPFEGEKDPGFIPRRPMDVERAGEELERRLRRDSRRYDSGFYRY